MIFVRYAMAHAILAAATLVIYGVVQSLAGFDIRSSAFPVLPSLGAAAWLGGTHARATGQMPGSGAAWRFAAGATVVSVALLAVYYLGLQAFYPSFLAGLLAVMGAAVLGPALPAAGVAGIFLVNRYFLTSGAKSALRAQARRPGKR